MTVMKRDKFVGRYAIKLISSALVAVCNIVIQFLLPRAISVDDYGFYTYNLNVFTSVVVMANLSASSALVAKYSKKCEDIGYVKIYLWFFAFMTAVLSTGLMGIYGFKSIRNSFGGQSLLVVMLGLEASIVMKLMSDVVSLYDAAAISRFPAFIQVIQRIVLCLFVIGSYLLGHLELKYFYIGQITIFIIVLIVMIAAFFKDYHKNYKMPIVRKIREYFKEYYDFCRPLIVAGIISQGIVILMNYTLMKYSGASEQAMFGAAWQLNTLVGYVFSPYAELMKREFAVITDQPVALKYRMWQSVKTVIWIGTYFAIFIAVFAHWLLPLLYGDGYANAVSVTQMIMVYTIFQAWGQICGSFLIATEATRGYAVLCVIGQIVSVLCVLLFQIPNFFFPTGLGSSGIGLTYMCSNYISVIAMMIYILKKYRISHMRMHGIYVIAIGSCALIAFAIRMAVTPLFYNKGGVMEILGIGICGLIYTIVIGLEIYLFPDLIGVKRETIKDLISKVTAKWERK